MYTKYAIVVYDVHIIQIQTPSFKLMWAWQVPVSVLASRPFIIALRRTKGGTSSQLNSLKICKGIVPYVR